MFAKLNQTAIYDILKIRYATLLSNISKYPKYFSSSFMVHVYLNSLTWKGTRGKKSAPGGNRTRDLRFIRPALCLLSYRSFMLDPSSYSPFLSTNSQGNPGLNWKRMSISLGTLLSHLWTYYSNNYTTSKSSLTEIFFFRSKNASNRVSFKLLSRSFYQWLAFALSITRL